MAIFKRSRKSGVRYQVKVRGTDGKWVTGTFDRLADAEKKEVELKHKLLGGLAVTNIAQQASVAEYFDSWNEETKGSGVSAGWRDAQVQMYRDYVAPVLGTTRLQGVTPAHVVRVLANVKALKRGSSIQLHVFNLLHKMFEDAVELFEILDRNPALRKLRPRIPEKESRYLKLPQAKALLEYVEGKPYHVAVALQLFAGLRVGEVQALRWDNVDLDRGVIHVRETYVRREGRFKDYPKGRKWHSVQMPQELWTLVRGERERSRTDFVVVSPGGVFLHYFSYAKALKRYCHQAGVPEISTHGLRHTTSELYMAHGATRDDLRMLFAHSSSAVTDRYVHDKGERVHEVAKVIQLMPRGANESGCSPNVPQERGSGTVGGEVAAK